MDNDRVAGFAKVVKGKVKAALGKAAEDARLRSESDAEKLAGRRQNTVGSAKRKLRRI